MGDVYGSRYALNNRYNNRLVYLSLKPRKIQRINTKKPNNYINLLTIYPR